MIQPINSRWTRRGMTLMTAGLLILAGFMPASLQAYSQRRITQRPQADQRYSVYNRSYLRGYNEGFTRGQADWSNGSPRDLQRPDSYQQGDRSYDQRPGSSGDATEGYQLGLELGYSDGYYGRARNTVIPGNAMSMAQPNRQRAGDRRDNASGTRDYSPVSIPENTEMRLRLTSPISTKTNQVGDRFTAIVTSPSQYEGATVEGHIAALNRSGRVSGKTELALAFDSLTLQNGARQPLTADLENIIISEQVKKVDEEGRVETGSRTRDSGVRGGIGAAAGAVIGGIIGGGKGALVGLVLGGAAGVGTVYVEGNNDLILDTGTEMVIRTAGRR